ncbi:MAG: VOC family protein [Chthoniobacterales bacterium]|nr:VOC family protein [Chthoniobacterales bacterium]
MKTPAQRITPFLWFDGCAEEAAAHYVSIFPDSRIKSVTRYDAAGAGASGQPEGSVMTVAFQLDGQEFVAINGGPQFPHSCAVSFVVNCTTQAEVDHYWEKLSAGGDPSAQMCGWLADKFGVSWQIVPVQIPEILTGPDAAKAQRVMKAVLGMKKIDLAAVEQAANL